MFHESIPQRYWDYVAIGLLISFVLLLLYLLMSRLMKNYESVKEHNQQVDRIMNSVIDYSHNFLELMTIFHSRAKFNPENIESIGEHLTLNLSNLNSYSVLYFSKKKDVMSWVKVLDKCSEHYTELNNRVVPPRPMSKAEFESMRDDLNEHFTDLMRIVRTAKYN